VKKGEKKGKGEGGKGRIPLFQFIYSILKKGRVNADGHPKKKKKGGEGEKEEKVASYLSKYLGKKKRGGRKGEREEKAYLAIKSHGLVSARRRRNIPPEKKKKGKRKREN